MTAAEYFRLPDDGYAYELVNGVLLMSPSPRPRHQRVLLEVAAQLSGSLRKDPVGVVHIETDVEFAPAFVYRPDLCFYRVGRVKGDPDHLRGAPDLVVEIISPQSRRYDSETKRADYERFGVQEYWLIDPQRETMTFLRLSEGQYAEVAPEGDTFGSAAATGFSLDLAAVRASWQPL
ncbi:MAG: Uma2 family endonuclease [Planctomycetota bacterium]